MNERPLGTLPFLRRRAEGRRASRPIIYPVDASLTPTFPGYAGIAVVPRDRNMELVAANVVRVTSSTAAEVLAVRRGLAIASLQAGATKRVAVGDVSEPQQAVVVSGRREVRPAHVAARQAIKAWVTGRQNTTTYPQRTGRHSGVRIGRLPGVSSTGNARRTKLKAHRIRVVEFECTRTNWSGCHQAQCRKCGWVGGERLTPAKARRDGEAHVLQMAEIDGGEPGRMAESGEQRSAA